jgi:hypothetical protein
MLNKKYMVNFFMIQNRHYNFRIQCMKELIKLALIGFIVMTTAVIVALALHNY